MHRLPRRCARCHERGNRKLPIAIRPMEHLRSKRRAALATGISFPNFRSALDFTNKIGALVEAEGHHPALTTEYGKVTVAWWTHKIKNIHRNDLIMAAKTDEIFENVGGGR